MKFIYGFFLIVLPLISFGQITSGSIKGILIDSTTLRPIKSATIVLENEKDSIINGIDSGEQGQFAFSKVNMGIYKIRITYIGYYAKYISNVIISSTYSSVDLGNIWLALERKMLSEVVITGKKALFEDKGDRFIYHAEKDIANVDGTAADLLSKVPMLMVDLNGNLRIRGSTNVRVLVNGKPSSIMARNLAEALKQMPANSIKSVEVISSPGAKYDAEGSAGVVNILTKKAENGTNGTLNATLGNLRRRLGLNLSVGSKKLSLTTTFTGYQYRELSAYSSFRNSLVDGQPTSVLFQQSSRDNTSTGGNGNLNFDYDPDSLNHTSFSANVWGGDYPQNSALYLRLTDTQGAILQELRRDIQYTNRYGNIELNLGWTRLFKTTGREFLILAQYARMPDNYFYNITQMGYAASTPMYLERGTNYSRNKEFTIQTDYVHPFTMYFQRDTASLKVEVGAKTIRRIIGSEFTVDGSTTGQAIDYAPLPDLGNSFSYNQQVTAGYASLRVETKREWNLIVGLRFEHTGIQGDFISTQTRFSTRYNNLIPSFTLAKTFKGSHTLKASYTQRISRPLIWYLNPFRNTSDPKNITTGNPYLNPEMTHATELSYSMFGKGSGTFNVVGFWRQTNNSIEFITTVDAAGVATGTFQNIGRNASYGLSLNGTFQPNKNLDVTLGSEVMYMFLSSLGLNQQNSGLVPSLNTTLLYKLPHGIKLQTNGLVSASYVQLQGTPSGWFAYGVTIKREFWEKRASLTLNITNPFNYINRVRTPQTAVSFQAETINDHVNRSIRITLNYKFGQPKRKERESPKISNDDNKGSR